jgi:uncharacterized BrkB/YihY/UPF0761 family membrane protein
MRVYRTFLPAAPVTVRSCGLEHLTGIDGGNHAFFIMDTSGRPVRGDQRFMPRLVRLLNMTFRQWLQDKAPQLGAALAYYTVFSPAPLMLVLLAVFGMVYGNSEVARREILHQLYAFLDRSSAKAVEDIATSTGKPAASAVATMVGIAVALFGASGVFGQLQDALNTIWGVKPKLFLVGKYALGLYLGSGAVGSACGAAGSLITMLLWVYYASQIVLFGAEFTQVYAHERGRGIRPAKHAVRVERQEIELPPPPDRRDKRA